MAQDGRRCQAQTERPWNCLYRPEMGFYSSSQQLNETMGGSVPPCVHSVGGRVPRWSVGLMQTRMKTVLLVLFSSAAMFGQVVPGRYILELSSQPAAATSARRAEFAGRRASVRQGQLAARAAVAARGGVVV